MNMLRHTLAFIGTTIILWLVIATIHQIPMWMGTTTTTSWSAIDQTRRVLPFHPILPIYYPDYLNWPPSDILTFGQPATCLVFHLQRPNVTTPVYAIRECPHTTTTTDAPTRLDLQAIHTHTTTTIHSREISLYYGTCLGGRQCINARWSSNDVDISVISTDGANALLRMVDSMIIKSAQNDS